MGAECNDTHAQHRQRPQKWYLPQFKCYCSVNHDDPAVLTNHLLSYFINFFQPLEVVSRYRDPQLQVAENYSHVFDRRPYI